MDKEMREALEECRAYNRMGGLTDAMLEDIAHDHGVDVEKLREVYEESD